VPMETLAYFDPLGNATHTALSFDLVGEDVLITGAGPIGIMAAAIAKHVGARYVVITDVNEYRLALARRMGVDVAVDVREVQIVETAEQDLELVPRQWVGGSQSTPREVAVILFAGLVVHADARRRIPSGRISSGKNIGLPSRSHTFQVAATAPKYDVDHDHLHVATLPASSDAWSRSRDIGTASRERRS